MALKWKWNNFHQQFVKIQNCNGIGNTAPSVENSFRHFFQWMWQKQNLARILSSDTWQVRLMLLLLHSYLYVFLVELQSAVCWWIISTKFVIEFNKFSHLIERRRRKLRKRQKSTYFEFLGLESLNAEVSAHKFKFCSEINRQTMPYKRTCLRYAHTNGQTHCCYTDAGE